MGLVLRDREDSSSAFGIYLKAPRGSACLCSSCVPIKGNGIGGTVSWSCFRDHLEGDPYAYDYDCSHSHVCPERFLCTYMTKCPLGIDVDKSLGPGMGRLEI